MKQESNKKTAQQAKVYVEPLREYSEQDVYDIGALMPYLSESFNDSPVDENHLTNIIKSPFHEQLVARLPDDGRIVGAATLSIIMGAGVGEKGWLEDMVSDQDCGISGIGQLLWDRIAQWCKDEGVDLHFTSRSSRVRAHELYKKNGAKPRETVVFVKHF